MFCRVFVKYNSRQISKYFVLEPKEGKIVYIFDLMIFLTKKIKFGQ
jgi:hypothetical protein